MRGVKCGDLYDSWSHCGLCNLYCSEKDKGLAPGKVLWLWLSELCWEAGL